MWLKETNASKPLMTCRNGIVKLSRFGRDEVQRARLHATAVALSPAYSRMAPSWSKRDFELAVAGQLSNTLGADFCVDALEEALSRYGRPEIFNTDQGSQFTSDDFTGTLKRHGIMISMDGKGRCMDNIFVERLWRSLKYEEVVCCESLASA